MKDRLYTSSVNSLARRSAQTAIWYITHALLRVIAPILSFTAEEAWSFFASSEEFFASDETIFTQVYYVLPDIENSEILIRKFNFLRSIRIDVNKRLEEARERGEIGSSLQAEVKIQVTSEKFALLNSLGDDLKFLLITSSAAVSEVKKEDEEIIIVTASTHQKCGRCWHYRSDVGMLSDHPNLCNRCIENLFGSGEKRYFS